MEMMRSAKETKDNRFADKVAVVTGAGQGLGEAFAWGLAAGGADIALIGRTESKLQAVAEALRKEHKGTVLICPGDIACEEDVKNIFSRILAVFGTIDILINNAAVHRSLPVVDTPLIEWQRQIDVNLTGAFLCSRAALPGMIKKRYGKIINISSSAADHFFPGFGAYAASKAGLAGFTKTLSEEVKHHNINVNVLLLGMINTEGTRNRLGKDPAVTIGLDQMLQVEDVAKTVLFFASDDSSAIMGASIDVFGKKA
jgi:NAD(P)-dependent dehydrogenase (short-subunit alcohol dehydrogenase family)